MCGAAGISFQFSSLRRLDLHQIRSVCSSPFLERVDLETGGKGTVVQQTKCALQYINQHPGSEYVYILYRI